MSHYMFIFAIITYINDMEKIECIENQFIEKIVVTLPELSRLLNVSIRTIQRITRGWNTIRSYDHNGRYFSLFLRHLGI